MRLLLAFIAAALPWTAHAQLSLTVPFASYHQGHPNKWCESNPGIGVDYAASDWVIVGGGIYRNSQCIETKYVRVRGYPVHIGPLDLGLMAGVGTGYRRDGGIAILPPIPHVRFRFNDRYSVGAVIVPPIRGRYVLGFEFGRRF